VGFWNSPEEIRKLRAADTRFEPKIRAEENRRRAGSLEESGRAVKELA
jgi:glycerol kinase